MQVLKFGGTSVRNAEALTSVSAIVRQQALRNNGTVVVLSATAGTTNALLALA
ncbi:MAG: aspartate kinase, partial [Ignavibacteria bacterium]